MTSLSGLYIAVCVTIPQCHVTPTNAFRGPCDLILISLTVDVLSHYVALSTSGNIRSEDWGEPCIPRLLRYSFFLSTECFPSDVMATTSRASPSLAEWSDSDGGMTRVACWIEAAGCRGWGARGRVVAADVQEMDAIAVRWYQRSERLDTVLTTRAVTTYSDQCMVSVVSVRLGSSEVRLK